MLPWMKAARIKTIGVTGARRSRAFPEVPTIAESGLPGYEAINWYGVMVPARTPVQFAAFINREIPRWATIVRESAARIDCTAEQAQRERKTVPLFQINT